MRIYSLDVIKLLFAYIIALGHFGCSVSPGGGVTVQLFFIISGIFLAQKFYQKSFSDPKKEYHAWHYTKDHIRSLYPHYVFSLIVLALYYFLYSAVAFLRTPTVSSLSAIIRDLYKLIPEALILQNCGFFGGGINYPLWQLSTLIISGYFVYALLCLSENWSRRLIFPAAILMIYAFLETDVSDWGTVSFFHVPLLRAFAPLCIGVLFFSLLSSEWYARICKKTILLNSASLIAFACIFLFKGYNNVYLIVFPIFLLSIFNSNSWINFLLNHRLFRSFADLSYAIYLNHALIKVVLNRHIFPRVSALSDGWETIVFLVVLTIYSICTMVFVKALKRWISSGKKEKVEVFPSR